MSVAKYLDKHVRTAMRNGVFSVALFLLCATSAHAETPSKESVLRLLAIQSNENLREVFYQAIEFVKENSLDYDASLDEMMLSEATSQAALIRFHNIRVSIYQKHYTQQEVNEEIACGNSPAAIKWNNARPRIKKDMRMAHERWQVRVAQQTLRQYENQTGDSNTSNSSVNSQMDTLLLATPSQESVRQFLSITEYSKESMQRKAKRKERQFLSALRQKYPDAPQEQLSEMSNDVVSDKSLEQLSDAYISVFQKHFSQHDIDKLLECYGNTRAKIRHSTILSETFKATRAWTIDLLDRAVQKRKTQMENSE